MCCVLVGIDDMLSKITVTSFKSSILVLNHHCDDKPKSDLQICVIALLDLLICCDEEHLAKFHPCLPMDLSLC